MLDCLALWDVVAHVTISDDTATITAPDGTYTLQPAPREDRPARWLLQTPERRAANRPPRAAPSIVAALSALRNALGAAGGSTLRIGPGGTPP